MAEDGPMADGERMFLGLAVVLIDISWICSALVLLWRCIHGISFVIDENGISDTFVCMFFLAFFFVFPVKRIPWDAVKKVTTNERRSIQLKLDTARVDAGWIAKLFLKAGYIFPLYRGKFSDSELKTAVYGHCDENSTSDGES